MTDVLLSMIAALMILGLVEAESRRDPAMSYATGAFIFLGALVMSAVGAAVIYALVWMIARVLG